MRRLFEASAALALVAGCVSPLAAQAPPPDELIMVETGARLSLDVNRDRGYRAFPLERLESVGWEVDESSSGATAVAPDGTEIVFVVGSPFFEWGDELFHLTDGPYRLGRRVWVPLQLLVDFLPRQMPGRYSLDPITGGLLVREPVDRERSEVEDPFLIPEAREPVRPEIEASPLPVRGGRPVVVIDAGHGGRDEGAASSSDVLEKDVAFAFAQAAAAELRRRDAYDVYVTRGEDRLIDLWDRGEMATEWRGDAPGIFLSIHANSAPDSSAQGVETFFLAEARTEHATRVAALENQVRTRDLGRGGRGDRTGLGPLLADLRNDDIQRWSAQLASLVQRAVGPIHPGPSRGVKQGPFAVLTNTMMPAALLEVGFLTNEEDVQALQSSAFRREMASAIADAIDRFFLGYPPGPPGGLPSVPYGVPPGGKP